MIEISTVAQSMTSSAIREILKITQRPEVISFAGGLPAPELFPVEEIRAATAKVLTDQPTAALQYSTTEGHLPLRTWIAEREQIAPDQVQITTGSQQGLDLLGRVLLNPGDLVGVEAPTYLGALQAFAPYQPRFVEVPTDDDGIVPAALDDQLRDQPIKVLYTVPTFQNPTGRTLSAERRQALLEVARRHGVTIIEDGPYNELRFRGERLPTLFELALRDATDADELNVIKLGTFSKVLAPGLRDAWVQGPRPVIDKLVQAKQAADLHSPTLNQMIISELLDEVLPRQVAIISKEYGRRARVMIDNIAAQFPAGAHCTDPDGGMFCWVTLGDDASIDTAELLPAAVDAGVAYVPGRPFFASGAGGHTLRLSYVTSTEEQIATGVAALGRVIGASMATVPPLG